MAARLLNCGGVNGIKKINLLLGSAERRLNCVIEAAVLDVCYNQAAVESTKTLRLGEFVRHGSLGSFDLMMLLPDCLLAEPGQRGGGVPLERTLAAIRTLRNQRSTPLILLSSATEDHSRFVQAGADWVTHEAFNEDELKSEVRRLLQLPEPEPEPEPNGWSLATLLVRGVHLLKKA